MQRAWQIYDRIVFPVNDREVLLDEVGTTITQEARLRLWNEFRSRWRQWERNKNHIHLLCRAYPIVTTGRKVQRFTRITAREIFCRTSAVKRVLWGGEVWTDGYDVATVWERADWQTVEWQVQRQGPLREDLAQLECASSVIPSGLPRGASFQAADINPLATLRGPRIQLGLNVYIDIRGGVALYEDTISSQVQGLFIGANTSIPRAYQIELFKAPVRIGCRVEISPHCMFHYGLAPERPITKQQRPLDG